MKAAPEAKGNPETVAA
jgi:transposase